MVRKKKTEEYKGRIEHALIVLGEISNDNTTPRNIRRAATDSMGILNDAKFTVGLRAANAINILDEILQDVNMPPYTRVKLWNVMSMIEAIRD